MGKFFGFNENYVGLQENEAWTRLYDKGKNLMPIKNNKIQRKYNNMFKKKTKVMRNGQLKVVKTDTLVPGDIILIEKGDFVPVDGIVLEANGLYMENDIGINSENIAVGKQYYEKDKPVFQGMKVKSGKGVIQAERTGAETLLGEQIKDIDLFNKKEKDVLKKYMIVSGIFTLIMFAFALIIRIVKGQGFGGALSYGLITIIAFFPVSFIITTIIRICMQVRLLKKFGFVLKNKKYLFNFEKLNIVCIDKKFLNGNYDQCIRDIFNAGIRIAVISEEGMDNTLEVTTEAGIDTKNAKCFSGDELERMNEEEYLNAICNGVIFYDINHRQKGKMITTFQKAGVNVLSIGSGIEDLSSIWKACIGLSSNRTKRSIDRGLADLLIDVNSFQNIYRLIKNRIEFRKTILSSFKLNILFQIPLMFLTLLAVISGIDIFNFIFQLLTLEILVIPCLLMFGIKGYSEEEIFIPYKKEITVKNVFVMLLIGIAVFGILTVLYVGLSNLIQNQMLNIWIIAIIQVVFYWICTKFKGTKKKEDTVAKESVIL